MFLARFTSVKIDCLVFIMIVHCIDIGGIVDHHCLNFLFIILKFSIYLQIMENIGKTILHGVIT
jgi:hypothetical protein